MQKAKVVSTRIRSLDCRPFPSLSLFRSKIGPRAFPPSFFSGAHFSAEQNVKTRGSSVVTPTLDIWEERVDCSRCAGRNPRKSPQSAGSHLQSGCNRHPTVSSDRVKDDFPPLRDRTATKGRKVCLNPSLLFPRGYFSHRSLTSIASTSGKKERGSERLFFRTDFPSLFS